MKVRITESVDVHAITFNGKVGYDRPAPLSVCVLLAAEEKPGITREELSEHFAIPMPWVSRLCSPLLAAKLLTETKRGIRVTAKARKDREMLPVEEREGNFLALVLGQPIDGHTVLCCVPTDEIRVHDDDIGDLPFDLAGESFSASGELTLATNKEGKAPRTEKARSGTLLEVAENACVVLTKLEASILTENGRSSIVLRRDLGLTHVTNVRCEIELPVSLRFPEPEKLAVEVIRRHNVQRTTQSTKMGPNDLLRDFADLTQSELSSAKGQACGHVVGGGRCEVREVPIYPRTRMAFQEWATWMCRGLFNRHMTREQAEALARKAAASVPGNDEYGPLELDVVRGTLSPKQLSYLSSADCWPALPR